EVVHEEAGCPVGQQDTGFLHPRKGYAHVARGQPASRPAWCLGANSKGGLLHVGSVRAGTRLIAAVVLPVDEWGPGRKAVIEQEDAVLLTGNTESYGFPAPGQLRRHVAQTTAREGHDPARVPLGVTPGLVGWSGRLRLVGDRTTGHEGAARHLDGDSGDF